jgi:diguanylate cyclase (GGDEF)-like protein
MLDELKFLQSTIDAISAYIAIIDEQGEIVLVNKQWSEFARANGLKVKNDGVGENYLAICDTVVGEGANDAQEAAAGIRKVIAGDLNDFYLEYACHHHSQKRWFSLRVTRLDEGSGTRLLLVHEDVPARILAVKSEREMNESRLNSLLELSQMAHTLSEEEVVRRAIEEAVRLTDSEIGYLHFVNPDQKTIQLVTWSEKTLEQCTAVFDSHYPIDEAGVWADCVRQRKPVVHNDYQGLPDKKGYPEGHMHLIRHASVPIYNNGKVSMILGVGNKVDRYDSGDVLQLKLIGDQLQKILHRKQAETKLKETNKELQAKLLEIESLQVQLRQQAIRDYLTGLFNRRYMEETLKREIARAERESTHLSLMILDGDNFKEVNDTFGHQAGDVVLKKLSEFLLENYRAGDVICRYGGDEFVVVMPNSSVENAHMRAEKWQESFADTEIKYKDDLISVTFSIGIATYPVHATSAEELLRSADQALYYSKNHKTRVSVSSNGAQ